MILQTRLVLMVTSLLIAAVIATAGVLTWTARRSILTQTEMNGLLVAQQLARSAKFVERLPRDVENVIGDQMVVQATLTAHLMDKVRQTLFNLLGNASKFTEKGLIQLEVITLDAMMPGLDGWAVLAALKADPEVADIPVVMLTMMDNQDMGFALGAADYLVKPVSREQLLQEIRQLMATRAAGEAVRIHPQDKEVDIQNENQQPPVKLYSYNHACPNDRCPPDLPNHVRSCPPGGILQTGQRFPLTSTRRT